MRCKSWAVGLLFFLSIAPAAGSGVDFELEAMDAKPVRLSDYRGKWVVVNYWATWCTPCREEMPELNTFHAAHKDSDAVVLGVNLEEIELARLQGFVEQLSIEYPILIDRPREKTPLGPIPGMPATYIVSPGGEVVAWQIGGITRKLLERFLASSDNGKDR